MKRCFYAPWAALLLLLLAGCANQAAMAPIEARQMKKPEPVVRAPPPVAAKPAPKPQTNGVVVKPLEEVASPAQAAIALPVPGEATPLLPAEAAPLPGELDAVGMVPAVAELVAKADQASAEGQHEAARANLERALKIAPRDASLWHRLATVSYSEGDWSQAKTLAERSLSLAPAGSPLGARNWTLIGNAESKLGNQSAASAAFERAGVPLP